MVVTKFELSTKLLTRREDPLVYFDSLFCFATPLRVSLLEAESCSFWPLILGCRCPVFQPELDWLTQEKVFERHPRSSTLNTILHCLWPASLNFFELVVACMLVPLACATIVNEVGIIEWHWKRFPLCVHYPRHCLMSQVTMPWKGHTCHCAFYIMGTVAFNIFLIDLLAKTSYTLLLMTEFCCLGHRLYSESSLSRSLNKSDALLGSGGFL